MGIIGNFGAQFEVLLSSWKYRYIFGILNFVCQRSNFSNKFQTIQRLSTFLVPNTDNRPSYDIERIFKIFSYYVSLIIQISFFCTRLIHESPTYCIYVKSLRSCTPTINCIYGSPTGTPFSGGEMSMKKDQIHHPLPMTIVDHQGTPSSTEDTYSLSLHCVIGNKN